MPKQSMMNLFLTATPDGNNKTLLSHVVVSIFKKIVKMCLAPKRINHLLIDFVHPSGFSHTYYISE